MRPPSGGSRDRFDADALDAAVGSWLAGRLRALAVDGKAVRGTRHASSDGQAVHLLAAADQQAGAVLARARVDGKTNEITRFAPLLEDLDLAGYVVTADAMHTQREHPKFLVRKKRAGYILVVKKNQPALHAQLKNLPGATSRPGTTSTTGAMAARSTARSKPPPSPPDSVSRTLLRPSASPPDPAPVRR